MNGHLKAFIVIVIIGVLGLGAAKIILPMLDKSKQLSSSDAKDIKGNITIAYDSWAGYIPLCSQEMQKRMRQSGYLLECQNDNANYDLRMSNLKKGSINFAVATVDSYILNAEKYDFPGTIIAVIDESKGGDALVANKNRLKTIDNLKAHKNLKIAFTPDSPSEHLLRSIGSHFDVPMLVKNSGSWRIEKDGSEAALKELLKGSVDAAVVWEPDVSKALKNPDMVKILGTEDTTKLIVDILVVNRDYSLSNPDAVKTLLNNYFKTLKFFKLNPDKLIDEIRSSASLDSDNAQKVIKGVSWVNLTDNYHIWFGVDKGSAAASEGLVETIYSTVDILLDAQLFSQSPLPDGNPYRITNNSFIETTYKQTASGFNSNLTPEQGLKKEFKPLPESGWETLREVGTLKIHPISFQSGTHELSDAGKNELQKAIKQLKHYQNFRVIVKGHTGLRGDKQANLQLSQQRADAVMNHLISNYGLNKNRIRAIGYGAEKPLPKIDGESSRAYNYRLPRVELYLVSEEI